MDRPKAVLVNDAQELIALLTDTTLEVVDFNIMNYGAAYVQYKQKQGFLSDNKNSNPYIAAWTTGMARLRLYEQLQSLGDRVLYMDTGKFF